MFDIKWLFVALTVWSSWSAEVSYWSSSSSPPRSWLSSSWRRTKGGNLNFSTIHLSPLSLVLAWKVLPDRTWLAQCLAAWWTSPAARTCWWWALEIIINLHFNICRGRPCSDLTISRAWLMSWSATLMDVRNRRFSSWDWCCWITWWEPTSSSRWGNACLDFLK